MPYLKPPTDTDELASRMEGLKESWQTTIAAVARSGDRETSKIAKVLNIGEQSVYNRLNNVYAALGIPNGLTNAEKKLLLRQGWGRLTARRSGQVVAQVAVQVIPPDPPAETPAPRPVVLEQTSTQAPVPQAQSFGSGVVIPLPPHLKNVDVYSGLFNGGEPTVEMTDALRKRKKQGLKPAYLVLSPSNVDPAMTLAQVVFFDREE
ncbi:hypothetical protein KW798_02660 [Candidatus Parcubacteria bacterium]|nr:hypothetical protein [Candidatus Parcubacteria bacterium]